MEGTQTALINRGDTGPYMKLLPGKDLYSHGTQDESSYVELDSVLDMKCEGTKTLKVTLTGESNHLGIFKSKGDISTAGDKVPSQSELNLVSVPSKDCESTPEKYSGDVTTEMCVVDDFCYSEPMSPSAVPNSNGDYGDSPICPDAITGPFTEIIPLKVKDPCHLKDVSSKIEELQYTDMFLYKTCESEDCESVVLSARNVSGSLEDESHFITTHEIQLTELDHDVDGDFELESCGDVEDDNLVYSFVDYASFDSDETIGADIEDDGSLAPVSSDQALSDNTAPCPASAPVASKKHENDPGESDKCCSSDDSLPKAFQNGTGNSAGQIHLSIKTTSRAINKSSNGKETENTSDLAKHEGDWSRYVYKTKDGKGDGTCSGTNGFIPAPGRVHFGRKLKGMDFEYSSGASSSVSELDDADKEVRNLTARAFKSLALPYFDAISLSASSESSVSEHGQGTNNWSLLTGAHRLLSQKTSTFQANKNAGGKGVIGYTQAKLNSLFAVNGNLSNAPKPSSTTKKVEFRGQVGQLQNAPITSAETANSSCKANAGVAESEKQAKLTETTTGSGSIDENTGALPNEQGTEASSHACKTAETTDSSHEKATFASSLLKNIISKKMQVEQERKIDQGGTQAKEQEETAVTDAAGESRDSHKQNLKTSGAAHVEDSSEAGKGALLPSENSAFRTWKNGEAGQTDEKGKPVSSNNTGEINIDLKGGNAKSNKTSQFFLTKIQPQPATGQEPGKQAPTDNNSTRAYADQGIGGGWKMRKAAMEHLARGVLTSRSPEIKISVRTVKDNKAKPFNIASLLTPNIAFSSASHIRPCDSSRSRALIASLKGEWAERMPHFMVRDIRDNKYKLLTPIHQVRDVRKLVKSSYHFVSLDNQERKTSATVSGEQKGARPGPERRNMALFSPMVIKCQSVNTNSGPDTQHSECVSKAFKRRPPVIAEGPEPERSPPPPATERGPNSAQPPWGKASQPSTVPSAKPSTCHPPEAPHKQDSVTTGNSDKRQESKTANKVALEKLQAAVRTMEELYVLDRNEWRRRTQAPQPVTDSHVLSLITSQEHRGTENAKLQQPADPASSTTTGEPPPPLATAPGSTPEPDPAPGSTPKPDPALGSTPKPDPTLGSTPKPDPAVSDSRHAGTAGSGRRTPPCASATTNKTASPQPHPAPSGTKSCTPKSVSLPVSLKTSRPKCAAEVPDTSSGTEPEKPIQAPARLAPGSDPGGNYLTIPLKGQTREAAPESSQDQAATCTASSPNGKPAARDPESSPTLASLPVAVGTQTLAMASPAALAQVVCFPQATTLQATPPLMATPPLLAPPSADPAQQTQRKMLLDPTTGQYYLVDTPIAPATRKLYDPETGQYMDVPAPSQPATPIPLSLSPLAAAAALSPSPYAAPTYVIYPSFLPSHPCPATTSPSRTLGSRLSMHSDGGEGGDSNHGNKGGSGGEVKPAAGRLGDPAHADTPAARSPRLQSQHVTTRGRGSTPDGKPIISITSRQQGPRIVAPPSFDGTTMSFVVEHR